MNLEQHLVSALLGLISTLLVAVIIAIAKLFITVNSLSIILAAIEKNSYNNFVVNFEKYKAQHNHNR